MRKEALTFENVLTDRLGKYSSDESITSLAEFVVQKITPRHPVRTFVFSLFATEPHDRYHVCFGDSRIKMIIVSCQHLPSLTPFPRSLSSVSWP